MERIAKVDDLGDFDKDNLSQVATNLRRPPGGVPAFTFGAKFISSKYPAEEPTLMKNTDPESA